MARPTLGASGGAAEAARVPGAAVRALACPSCGAAVALRAMDWTQTVACASCAAVFDARDPNLRVLRRAAGRRGPEPRIPLGTRGEWRGAPYDVIGFQERAIGAEGVSYAWREYVLFNPYRGFRYLTEYDGHWNDVVPLPALPAERAGVGRPTVQHGGRTYRHFQTARAETTWVLGEFPWEARAGDRVTARDYVAPPFVLSAEDDRDETTWSLGEYVDGRDVWKAFGLPGRPPAVRGVYANQPSPHGRGGSLWPVAAVLLFVLFAATLARYAAARDAVAFTQTYTYTPGSAAADDAGATAFVTPAFDLAPARAGGAANVVVETEADLDNNWMFVDYALVDEATGRAYDVARDLDYYAGTDASDGTRWTEGSRRDRARIGPVPAGRYFVRAEPSGGESAPGARPVVWRLTVRRDVPSPALPLLAAVALLVPPVVGLARASAFEARRWAESDYAPSVDASASDEEE